MPPTTSAPTGRRAEVLSIQYLRGFAALAVLISHTLQWPLVNMNDGLLKTGRLGVDVFFVISGFIITIIAGDGAFRPASFLSRRALRIVPVYWAATVVVTVLALALPDLFRTTVPTVQGFIESLLFVPSESPKAPLLGLGWTLDYEVFFYLVFAALFFLKSEARTLLLCVGFAALIAIGQNLPHATMVQYFYTSPSLIGFTLGTLLAQAWRHGLIARFGARARTILFTALPVLLIGFYLLPRTEAASGSGDAPLYFHLVMSGAAACIVLAGLELEARKCLPRVRLFKYLGDASYSVYLFHLFALGAMWAIARHLLPTALPAVYLMVAFATVCVSLAFGLLVHHLLEKPVLAVAANGRPRQPSPGHGRSSLPGLAIHFPLAKAAAE